MGAPRGRPVRVGITDYAQDALGDVVFVQLPEVGADGRSRRELQRGRVHQVGLRHLRPGGGHGRRGQRGAGRQPGAAQRGPVRRGLDLRDRAGRPADGSRPCWMPRPTGPSSRASDTVSVADVCLRQLRAREPARVQFLLVLWGRARRRTEDTTTVTFSPVETAPDAAERRYDVEVDAVRRAGGHGGAGRDAGRERRLPLPRWTGDTSAGRHPTATSSSTTSRSRAATPRSSASRRRLRVRDVGSLNGTYVNRERDRRGAARSNGDEIQVGQVQAGVPRGRGRS